MDSVINICFVFDEKFVDLFKVSLLSVDKNTKSPLDIFIVDCGICEASKKSIVEFTKKLKNVRSVTFGTPERISEIEALAIPKYFSSAIFYRLAIPKIFPKLERVIYLDCDTITIGDIRELWEEDLHGRPIGIIEEEGNFFLPQNETGGIPQTPPGKEGSQDRRYPG